MPNVPVVVIRLTETPFGGMGCPLLLRAKEFEEK